MTVLGPEMNRRESDPFLLHPSSFPIEPNASMQRASAVTLELPMSAHGLPFALQ
jgi:hypothetical protein